MTRPFYYKWTTSLFLSIAVIIHAIDCSFNSCLRDVVHSGSHGVIVSDFSYCSDLIVNSDQNISREMGRGSWGCPWFPSYHWHLFKKVEKKVKKYSNRFSPGNCHSHLRKLQKAAKQGVL